MKRKDVNTADFYKMRYLKDSLIVKIIDRIFFWGIFIQITRKEKDIF